MVFARGTSKFYFLKHGSVIQRQKIIHLDRHSGITGVACRNMVEQIYTRCGPFKIGLESDQAYKGILKKVVFDLPNVGTFRTDFEWIHFRRFFAFIGVYQSRGCVPETLMTQI